MITFACKFRLQLVGYSSEEYTNHHKYAVERRTNYVVVTAFDEFGEQQKVMTFPRENLLWISETPYRLPSPSPGSGR